tara:strand:- start:202 stop:552 length:351 start_codon:yes stop_codon:yes gene_type:complete
MKKWSSRWIVVTLLGIALGTGMTLSAVQASTMAVDMALAGDINPSGDEDCGGCGSDDKTAAASCYSFCASTVFVMPAPANDLRLRALLTSVQRTSSVLFGTGFSPDPYPPRPTFLL